MPRSTSAAPTVDEFAISFGDVVSDGAPAPGAGNIEAAEAIDSYSFEVGGSADAIFDVLSGSAGAFRWTLTSPVGATILDHALYTDRRLLLTESGTYTLSVSGATPSTTGVYSFQLLAASGDEEFVIGIGDVVADGVPAAGAGNIEAPGGRDLYRFDAVAGTGVIVDHLAGSNVALGWQLSAPDGSVLFDGFLGDRQLDLPATGTYSLIVRGNGIDDTGVYSFQLLEAPPNSPPVLEPIEDQVDEEGATIAIDIVADDPDGDTLEIVASGLPAGITVDSDALRGTISAGAAGAGPYAVTITVTDSDAASATISFTWIVHPGNTPPVAMDDTADTERDTAVVVDILANDTDADGDALSILSTSEPSHGTVTVGPGGVSYMPDIDYLGDDSFTYVVGDGRGGTADAVVTVTVQAPPNDPPTIAPIDDRTDRAGDTVSVTVDAADPDGDPVELTATGMPTGVGLDLASQPAVLVGTIDGGAAGSYTVTITATDPHGALAEVSFLWTVTAGDPPTATITADVDVYAPLACLRGVRVALAVIHGADDLPVELIDLGSIDLDGAPVVTFLGHRLVARIDVDRDGFRDLVVLIRYVGAVPDATVVLSGRLTDGTMFAGSDEICASTDHSRRGAD